MLPIYGIGLNFWVGPGFQCSLCMESALGVQLCWACLDGHNSVFPHVVSELREHHVRHHGVTFPTCDPLVLGLSALTLVDECVACKGFCAQDA